VTVRLSERSGLEWFRDKRVWRAVLALAALGAFMTGSTPDGDPSPIVVVLLAVTAFRVSVMARRQGLDRRAWRWFGIALSFSAVGFVAMAAGVPVTNPAVVVVFSLSYPSSVTAQYYFCRSRTMSSQVGSWLDCAIVAFVGIAVLLATVASAQLHSARGPQIVVWILFPALSILSLSVCVFLCSLVRWRLPNQLLFLIIGQALLVGADLGPLVGRTFPWLLTLGTRLSAVAYVFAIAASIADNRWVGTEHDELRFSRVFALPWIGAVGAVAIMVWPGASTPGRLAAATAMILVIIRISLAYGRVRLAADHRREARTDELTGLPNRRAFIEHLDERVAQDAASAILVMDLDGFKEVNDSLGHHAGDQLLRTVGMRLSRVVAESRGSNRLFRLGGDEFACVVSLPADVEAFAQQLRTVTATPTVIQHQRIDQRVSVGIASFPGDSRAPGDVLRLADAAMYRAKQLQSGVVVHDEATSGDHSVLRMLAAVREALETQRFEMYFQPQVRTATGAVHGLEALLRLRKDGVMLPTDLMIGAARTAGLMRKLTDFVLDASFGAAAAMHHEFPDLIMSVNVSPEDLSSGSLAERVVQAAARHGVEPRLVCVEVTEEALLDDPAEAARTVERLRSLGFGVSMDDFGVGFSSLSNLRVLAVSELKIDRGFVSGLTRDMRTEALICAIADLARRLGANVLLEGVETQEEFELARSFGIDLVQGWVFSPALSQTDVVEWMRKRAVPRPVTEDLELLRQRSIALSGA
jgi:diguanylate cyclase